MVSEIMPMLSPKGEDEVAADDVVHPEEDGGAGGEGAPGGAGGDGQDAGHNQGHHGDGLTGDAGRQGDIDDHGAHAGGHKALGHAIGEHQDEEHLNDAGSGFQGEVKGVVKAAAVDIHTHHDGYQGGDGARQQQVHLAENDQAGKDKQRYKFQDTNRYCSFSRGFFCGIGTHR